MRWSHMARGIAAALVLFLGATTAPAEGEYSIGAEDVLSVTVWEHPELSRTVVVRADGTITLAPLGAVMAAGKGTETLSRDLEAKIYSVLRIASQVTVSVVAFNSRQVYVSGQVANPGRFSFEELPNLVDLLSGSGGLNPTADLTGVRILRKGEGDTPKTLMVDLAGAMNSGDMSRIPALQPGDVVYVPGVASPGGSAGGGVGGAGVYLVGEVARPGAYSLSTGMDLLQLLSLAGGSTPNGDLSRVELLGADQGDTPFRVRVNLEKEMREGRRGPEVRPGDTIVIPSVQAGSRRMAWTAVREALGVSRDVLNLILIRDVINP